MSFTTQNERQAGPHPHTVPSETGEQAPAHEIKYRQDAARYVASMLTELRQIACKAGFDKLVSAVDAAYYEAYAAQESQAGPTVEKSSKDMEQTHG